MGRVSFASNNSQGGETRSYASSEAAYSEDEEKKHESDTDVSSSSVASSSSRRWRRKRSKQRASLPPAPPSTTPPQGRRRRRNMFSSLRKQRSSSKVTTVEPDLRSCAQETVTSSSSPTSVIPQPPPPPSDELTSMRCGSHDDPVMKLFEQRNTQRVRFTLEGGPVVPQEQPPATTSPPRHSISRFLKGALFNNNKSDQDQDNDQDDINAQVQRELESVKHELVWESTETAAGGEVIRTQPQTLTTTFAEDPTIRAQVLKLHNKARRAEYVHFRYEYAVKYYLQALQLLQEAHYPPDHPVARRTRTALNHAHHVQSTYRNSANIVRMGLKHEDAGEWVRALKMYTIAYRMRVELLGRHHPSLVVLLNLLGNVQIMRGEFPEAMQVYELALQDQQDVAKSPSDLVEGADDDTALDLPPPNPPRNLLARSVTYRDMGTIYEKWGEHDKALDMYHQSLECLAEFKQLDKSGRTLAIPDPQDEPSTEAVSAPPVVDKDHWAGSTATAQATGGDCGMEVLMGRSAEEEDVRGRLLNDSTSTNSTSGETRPKSTVAARVIFQASTDYDIFFPPELDDWMRQQKKKRSKDKSKNHGHGDFADIDAAMTLHQIGQLHRSGGEFNLALSAFLVSLRGMKFCVGRNHPNVAAILGNIGNLQKEMGDMDASFATYQQVLGIESYRLGLSHPDVAVTLHNIATIDAARGNHEHALALYRQVIALQRKLFGPNHVTVAVTSACMGDVYERVGSIAESIGCFEEAVRIKTAVMGRHSLEVARLLHKLGKLAIAQGEFHMADSYVSRAILVYRLNKLSDMDEWMMDAARDGADIDAAIAMGFVDRGFAASNRRSSSFDGGSRGSASYDQKST